MLNEATEPASLADQRWLDKASRALRFGKSLSPSDPFRAYVGRPKSEVIDKMFDDPLFFTTMVDFYAFYFGFKSDDGISKKNSSQPLSFDPKTRILKIVENCEKDAHCVRYDTYYLNDKLFNHVAALNGAVIVSGGGSMDQLYSPMQPPFVAQSAVASFASTIIFASVPPSDLINGAMRGVSLEVLKSNLDKNLDSISQVVKSALDQSKSNSFTTLCDKVNDAIFQQGSVIFALESIVETGLNCPPNSTPSIHQVKKIYANAIKMRALTKDIFRFLEDYLTRKLILQSNVYFEIPASLKDVWKSRLYGETFWSNHPNSSTNYNRRRAAYVLKTFFCDDLTPVKLEIAKHPGNDQHASDASCMACHYKLDPLAGFFRFQGSGGFKFNSETEFFFDDNKRISGSELQKYLASWDFPGKKGPNNGLNVGLVRSSTDLSKNSYGSTLEDLGRLVANDPRTFMCKTQRLADYFIGGGLTYDRKWLERLATQIQAAPKESNGKAVKDVIKGLLLSHAFTADDPVEGVCYDRVSAKDAQSKLDCQVSSVLAKHCHKCHGPLGPSSGLDLSQWSDETGFFHEKDDGRPYSKQSSYQKILGRLGPSEAGPIMPLNSPMPDPERRILINWFEKQIQSSK